MSITMTLNCFDHCLFPSTVLLLFIGTLLDLPEIFGMGGIHKKIYYDDYIAEYMYFSYH